MPRYNASELTELFQRLQQFVLDSQLSLDAVSEEQACTQVVHSFFQSDVDWEESTSVAADTNKIIELLQNDDLELQETGLSLLHDSEDEAMWRQITDGFVYAEGKWRDCFSHQMYRVTLGLLRAWAENPFCDHSHLTTLTLRSDITERCSSISFVQHFPSVETLNLYRMSALQTLEGLENADKLVELDAQETAVSDLRGLGNNPSLKIIVVRDSPVATLNGIQTTHSDLSIDARGTPLTDVSAIPSAADAYLCVDQPPPIGSAQVTYLRFADEWLVGLRQFPNVHTLYVERALHSAKGLLELDHLKQIFVRGRGLVHLFGNALYSEIESLRLSLSRGGWENRSVLFGDNFWLLPVEDWMILRTALEQIEDQSLRTFHAADDRLWAHCAHKITEVRLLSDSSSAGPIDYTALATLPNIRSVELELGLRRYTAQLRLPPLRNVVELCLRGCSKDRWIANTRQGFGSIELTDPVFVESLVIRGFPALKNTFLRTFPRDKFPNLRRVVIRHCPKLSKRMAAKLFADIELTFE